MKSTAAFGTSILFVLLFASLACSLISGQLQPLEPTASVYATQITAGGVHACALLNNGKVKCWGNNSYGQLGDGTQTDHNIPVEVPNLTNAIAISAGGGHTCALIRGGEVKCWGQNTSGQLGDGTKDLRSTHVNVPDIADVVSISAGFEHTCAITKDGEAKCWGKNLHGRVGDGSTTRLILAPVTVAGLEGRVVAVSAGNEHTCGLIENGSVKCWGNNGYGQIGDDTTGNRKRPTNVINLPTEIELVGTGQATSCAITDDNSTLCWGWVGLQDYYLSPHEVDGLEHDIIAITVGGDFICGLTMGGTVKCLGENEYGQLGNGTTNAVYTATNVNGLESVTSIAANFYYTCALVSNGQVFCWGSNSTGQLGNGTNTDSLTPVQVTGLTE